MSILGRIYTKARLEAKKFAKKVPVYVQVPIEECLQGRVALITGGSSGIGYAIAEEFANCGAKVCITGRNEEKLEKAKIALDEKYPGKIFSYVMDCSKVDSFETAFNEMQQLIGNEHFDILVNNAGVTGSTNFPYLSESDYDMVMNTNLKGYVFMSQLFANYMVSKKIKGNILMVGSSSCLRPAISPYTISKWGVRGLTLGLAKSLAKYEITVNGIAPGPTATPLLKKSDEDIMNTSIPSGRYCTSKEIATMAVKLVSDSGKMVMGDMIYMTGGAGNLTYDDLKY